MTTRNRTLTPLFVAALALVLALCPLTACSSKQEANGPAGATVTDDPPREEGPADVDEEATTPEDEAAKNAAAQVLDRDTWVLAKTTTDTKSEYLSYHEVTTYERDSHGAVLSAQGELTDENGESLSSSLATFELDSAGNTTSAQISGTGDTVATVTYTYEFDDEGRVTERRTSDGTIQYFVYGATGSIVEVTSISAPSGDEDDFDYRMVNTYDELGFLLRSVIDYDGDQHIEEYHYEYAADGLPVSCGVAIDDAPTSTITFAYDTNGNIVRSETTSSDGTIVAQYEWTKVDEPTALVQAESYLRTVS